MIARTNDPTTHPSTNTPSRPTSAGGRDPVAFVQMPSEQAGKNGSSKTIRLNADFLLVVGRREMDQHFRIPAASPTKTKHWPANRPAVSASIGPAIPKKIFGMGAEPCFQVEP